MIMKKPEADVIRFSGSDVVAASNPSLVLSNFTGNVPGDGVVTYNGTNYEIKTESDANGFISALRQSGISNAGISLSSSSTAYSLRSVVKTEASTGGRNWLDGTYIYNPDATWTAEGTEYNGVFIRKK